MGGGWLVCMQLSLYFLGQGRYERVRCGHFSVSGGAAWGTDPAELSHAHCIRARWT